MATKQSQTAGSGGAAATATAARATKATKARAGTAVAEPVPTAVAPHVSEADHNATATLTPTPPPEPIADKKPGVERRRSVREKVVAPAVLQPPSGDASVEAAHGVTVQDLSLGGVGFRAAEKFAPGETYRITLGKGPLLLNARVKIVSCRQVGHRQYHVGAEFC
jgi:hypothetical protein